MKVCPEYNPDVGVKPPSRRWPAWLLAIVYFPLVLLMAFLPMVGKVLVERHRANQTQAELVHQLDGYRLAGRPVTIHDLVPAAVPDDRNSALDLRQAIQLVDSSSPWWTWHRRPSWVAPDEVPYTDAEILMMRDKVVEAHARVFDLIDIAMEKQGVDWHLQYRSPLNEVLLPHLNEMRELADLTRAAAIMACDRGDHRRAMHHVRQLLFLSESLRDQPFPVSVLVGRGIATMATETVFDIVSDLTIGDGNSEMVSVTAAEARARIAQLLDHTGDTTSTIAAIECARVGHNDFVQQFLAGNIDEGLRGVPPFLINLSLTRLKPAELRLTMRANEYYSGMVASLDSATWAEFQKRAPEFPTFADNEPATVAEVMLSDLSRFVNGYYRITAERRLAAVALAVRWYAVEHEEQLPPDLEALVPRYLPHVPADPFDPEGGPLRYIPDPTRPILYSVGEDGIDQGGSDEPVRRRYDTDRTEYGRWQRQDLVVYLSPPHATH